MIVRCQWLPSFWVTWSWPEAGPVTQPSSGWCPLWCGGSKNIVWRSSSWQRFAGDQDMAHAMAAAGGFAGRFAQARFPAHLRLAGPQCHDED
jgi:hypothetical protein